MLRKQIRNTISILLALVMLLSAFSTALAEAEITPAADAAATLLTPESVAPDEEPLDTPEAPDTSAEPTAEPTPQVITPSEDPSATPTLDPTPTETPAPEATPPADETIQPTVSPTPFETEPPEPTPTLTPTPTPTEAPTPTPLPTPAATAEALEGLKAGKDYVEDQLVFLADSEEEAQQIAQSYGGVLESFEYGLGIAVFEEKSINTVLVEEETASAPAVPSDGRMLFSLRALRAAPEPDPEPVLFPNYLRSISETDSVTMDAIMAELQAPPVAADAFTTPTDPGYSVQWQHTSIGSRAAWSAGATGEGIVVAVIDSGIDPLHKDLAPNVLDAVSRCSHAVSVKELKETRFDPYAGDNHGHGTHVSGIIAAAINNYGVVGVAPNAKLLSIKALDHYYSKDGVYQGVMGTDSDIVRAINYATSQNVDVINMSLGGSSNNSLLQTAINNAANAGVVVIAAAGNERSSAPHYPAACDNVISVGALQQGNVPDTSYTNYGSWVDISAPGTDIYSDFSSFAYTDIVNQRKAEFRTMSGTSMACPVVAGVAALILSKSPILKNLSGISRSQYVEEILESTATERDLVSSGMGAGMVSASAAVAVAAAFNAMDIPAMISATPVSPTSIEVVWAPVEAAEGYILWRTPISGGTPVNLGTFNADTTSFIDTTPVWGTSYDYAVQAFGTVEGVSLTGRQQTPGVTGLIPKTARPATLTATVNSPVSVTVQWSAVSHADGYYIWRMPKAGDTPVKIATVNADTTSYKDTSVKPASSYYYSVQGYVNIAGEPLAGRRQSPGVLASTPVPNAPVLVSAVASSPTKATIKWKKASGAEGYYIWRRPASGSTSIRLASVGADVTSYTDTTALATNAYYYNVQGYAVVDGETVKGDQHKTGLLVTLPVSAPPVMTAATPVGATSILVEWEPAEGAAGYYVLRANKGSTTKTKVGTVSGYASTSFTDAKAVGGKAYTYYVQSYARVGSTNKTGGISAKGKNCTIPMTAAPSFTAAATGVTRVLVSWSPVEDAEGYIITRKPRSGGTERELTRVSADVTSFEDTTAVAANSYYYNVQAFLTVDRSVTIDGNVTVESNDIPGKKATTGKLVTLPVSAPPVMTAATPVGATSILVEWEPAEGAAGYYVLRANKGSTSKTKVGTVSGYASTSFTDTKAVGGKAYTYYVQSYARVGSSNKTGGISAKGKNCTIPMTAAPSFTAAATGVTRVLVSWSPVEDAEGYIITRKPRSGGTERELTRVGADITSFEDTTAVAANSYYYNVQGYLSIADNKIPGNKAKTGKLVTLPVSAPPVMTAATPVGATSILVEWEPAEGAAGYYILRANKGSTSKTKVGTVSGYASTSFTDAKAVGGKAYTYYVQSYARVGSTNKTGGISAKGKNCTIPMTAAPSFTAAATGVTRVLVSWSPVKNAEGYIITRKPRSGGTERELTRVGADVTSFEDTTAVAANSYYYNVQGYLSIGDNKIPGNKAKTGKLVTLPVSAPPVITAATPVGATSILVEWEPAEGAAGYYVLRANKGSTSKTKVGTVSGYASSSFTDAKAVGGKAYTYYVQSYARVGSTNKTGGISAKGKNCTIPMTAAPSFTAAATGVTRVLVSWSPVKNAEGYIITRKPRSGGTERELTRVGADVTSFEDTTAVAANSYYYNVQAFLTVDRSVTIDGNVTVESNDIPGKKATTGKLVTLPVSAPPVMTAATPVGATSILVEWEPAEGAAGYYVLRANKGSTTKTKVGTVSGCASTSFTDAKAVGGKAYTYYVQSYSLLGTTKKAGRISATGINCVIPNNN